MRGLRFLAAAGVLALMSQVHGESLGQAAEEALKEVERWSDPPYAGKDRPACRVIRNSDRRKARADAARAREELKSLDEEARVGGALPGWVRE